MTIPSVASVGSSAAGTGDIAPAPGSHTTADLLLMPVATANQAVTPPTDWFEVPGSSVSFSTTGRITLLYRWAPSGATPTPTVADPGNHAIGVIIAVRDVDPDYPFAAVAGAAMTSASTTGATPAFVTPVNDCLVMDFFAWPIDSATAMASSPVNASLGSLTEQFDLGTLDGDGSGLIVHSGTKATAGDVDETTWTQTSSGGATLRIALRPKPAVAKTATVVIDGSPAPNASNVVRLVNITQPLDPPILASIAGGAGGWSANVRYSGNTYIALYNDGTSCGASQATVA